MREQIEKLLDFLRQWDRRWRLQRSLVWFPRAAIMGLALAVMLALLTHVRPGLAREQLAILSVAPVLGALMIALVVIWGLRHSALRVAQRFDRQFALKERISTALEVAGGNTASPNAEITERQVADAARRAVQIDARAYLPLSSNLRDWFLLAVLAVILVLLVGVYEPPLNTFQLTADAVQQEIEDLEDLREIISQMDELAEEDREAMLEELGEAIELLSQEGITQEEAVATLSELAQDLENVAAEVGQDDPQLDPAMQQALEGAAEQMAQQEATQELSESLQEGALDQAAQDMQALAENLEQLSESELGDLSEALENLAESLQEIDPELAEALQEAAEAMQEGDLDAAREALEQAAEQMDQQQQQQMAENAEQVEQQEMAQQMAQQMSQEAQEAAQQMAQSDSQPTGQTQQVQVQGEGDPSGESQSGSQSEGDQPGEGQTAPGDPNAPNAQSAQGLAPSDQSSMSASQTNNPAGGAGDAEGSPQEGGFAATGEQMPQDNNPDGSGMEVFEPIFAPQTIGGEGGPEVHLAGGDEPGDIILQEGEFTENPEGESLVGYNQVFSSYNDAAYEALDSEYIPLGIRDVVHDYFSSLEP